MKKEIILFILLITGFTKIFGQGVGIGINNPNASAILDLTSTAKGFLPPRMTQVQRNDINPKPAGLIIYNTTEHCLNVWNTTSWMSLCGTPAVDPSTNGTGVASYNCSTGASNGTLTVGTPASGVTKVIVATVTQLGTYDLSATANGVTYSGSGTFTATGAQNITLTATGTPMAAGTSSFTLDTTPNCTFTKTVNPAPVNTFTATAPVYNGNSVIDTQGVGYYAEAIPAASTIVVEVNVQQLGAYNLTGSVNITTESPITNLAITSQTLTYSASGTFTALGNQNVTFTRTAVTPRWYGTKDITINGTGVSNTKVISPRIDIKTLGNNTGVSTITYGTQVWMDRVLGAHRKAIQIDDPLAFGNVYNWGRDVPGIQVFHGDTPNGSSNIKLLNGYIETQSNVEIPTHNQMILVYPLEDWWANSPSNTLNRWSLPAKQQGPCPTGYHVPTLNDLNTLVDYNHPTTGKLRGKTLVNGFNTVLKFSKMASWPYSYGYVNDTQGMFMGSTLSDFANKYHLNFAHSNTVESAGRLYSANPVRCIRN